ncbi:hypothetical protein SAMN05661008_01237 [Alkalithermobacter thermoalcaliphilus JW-YL-7 = DSM 7308]|uniref:Pyridoxal phosphate homeostasis protein n=1 Tax=Alkalithermobacter thermoalcaliphilus JW-YL-7 = DSM 7308 TaxID=1121328 RepID=A0A150FPN8_CLOPD|nr:protein of unknown function UPF0001 [[Clostridium] paradoxum JW-YL-7 = DSM 7308]SHK97476.1 hypothetical protein SAMN05661008_01237 [[Clostridium] paradoxum JW-YL-7 = DSM 7308]
MLDLKKNLDIVLDNIEKYAKESNRKKEDITLIAVTKTVDIPVIQEAIKYGITDVGENKPQELVRKYDVIGKKVKWHMIGTLQTNKVKYIIDKVDLIHSLDRISLCEEINKRAKSINKVVDCLVQVNISKEETKHGIKEEEALDFIKSVSENFSNIRIKGLMTMAPYTQDKEDTRIYFRKLKELSLKISDMKLENMYMDYLSMGMSNDYTVAIQEGSNMIRLGTVLFGERNYEEV